MTVRFRLPSTLWAFWALFVVYGTTIPFHFTSDRAAIARKLSHVTLNPLVSPDTGRRVSIPDVVQNVLLFVPFGFLGVLTLRDRSRSVAACLAVVTALAALLSAAVETAQLFTIDRTTSVADLVADTTGALGGGLAALMVAQASRRSLARLRALGLVDVPAFYPLMIAAMIVIIAAWEPFDFTLDVGSLMAKVHALRADPWQFTGLTDEGVEFLRYLLFALIASSWLRQMGVRSAAMGGAAGGAAFAIGLEASQWIVGSRMPGLEDATVHAVGAMAGAGLSRGWPFGLSPTCWCALLWVATGIGAAMQMLSPFVGVPARRPFAWLPFFNYYQHTSIEIVSHVIELMLIYLPLGFSLAFIVPGRRRTWLVTAAAALALAFPLEYLQGWIDGRYSDITDVGMAVLGALLGAWLGGPARRSFSVQPAGVPGYGTRSSAPMS